MVGTLTGRTAVVTGAGRGIGRAVALGLAAEGAQLGLVARTQSELDGVAAEIRAKGGQAFVARAEPEKRSTSPAEW